MLLLLTAIVHSSSSGTHGVSGKGSSASSVTAASKRDTSASVPFSTTAVPATPVVVAAASATTSSHRVSDSSSANEAGTLTSRTRRGLDKGRSSSSTVTSASVAATTGGVGVGTDDAGGSGSGSGGRIIQVARKKNITAPQKHSGKGNLPSKIDRLLRSPAATNGLQNKHIQPRNAIKLERKDQQKQQQRPEKQQRSLKLTKRSSGSDSPFVDHSSLTQSLFNFLQSPGAIDLSSFTSITSNEYLSHADMLPVKHSLLSLSPLSHTHNLCLLLPLPFL